MSTFAQILNKFRQDAFPERDKGCGTVNSDSGIKNDPNDWSTEHNDPKYIYNLLLRIIIVSLETIKIVRSLPKLKLES